MTHSPLMSATSTTLVLVDYQTRLLPALQGGAGALAQALRMAEIAQALGVRVVGTEQNPAGLGPNDPALKGLCEATLAKSHFDACADGLLDLLRGPTCQLPREVVIGGCEAHVCLMQTGLGLLQNGLRVWVLAPACASRTAANQILGMQRLRDAGATLVSLEMVAFEWLRSCDDPRFRSVLPLLKTAPS